MKYIVDTSGFIYFSKKYGELLIVMIIEWFELLYSIDLIASVERARQELSVGNDALSEWAENCPPVFETWLPEHDLAHESVRLAAYQEKLAIGYADRKIENFMDVADSFIIAKAIAEDATVVTEEAPMATGKIQIPQICKRMGIRCINSKTMIEELNARNIRIPDFLINDTKE